MKNIIKTLFVMLTSVSLLSSANAGELGVSGTAKATYQILTGTHQAKGLGITNELNFTAAGELDNGYTWSYSMELDPADGSAGGAATNDDTALTLTTPYGTVGVFVLEGGLDVEDAASQSVYSRPTDSGDPSATVDNFTIDAYNNLQYHTPADLLPFATTVKVAYAPGLDGTNNSGNDGGPTSGQASATYTGSSAQEIQLKSEPVDGLKVGVSYFEFNEQGTTKNNQKAESGAYYASYALNNVTVGYSKAYRADLVADGGLDSNLEVESYDQTNMSIAYVINDDLSVSYEKETSEVSYQEGDEADVEQKSTGYQVAYNMGGMTLALSRNTHDNVGYSTTAPKQDQTLFAVTMAF